MSKRENCLNPKTCGGFRCDSCYAYNHGLAVFDNKITVANSRYANLVKRPTEAKVKINARIIGKLEENEDIFTTKKPVRVFVARSGKLYFYTIPKYGKILEPDIYKIKTIELVFHHKLNEKNIALLKNKWRYKTTDKPVRRANFKDITGKQRGCLIVKEQTHSKFFDSGNVQPVWEVACLKCNSKTSMTSKSFNRRDVITHCESCDIAPKYNVNGFKIGGFHVR